MRTHSGLSKVDRCFLDGFLIKPTANLSRRQWSTFEGKSRNAFAIGFGGWSMTPSVRVPVVLVAEQEVQFPDGPVFGYHEQAYNYGSGGDGVGRFQEMRVVASASKLPRGGCLR